MEIHHGVRVGTAVAVATAVETEVRKPLISTELNLT